MALLVINPGASATVQDEGRLGYREWGIGPGGAFDRRSSALANALLGNPSGCAVLELTLFGGVYEARIPLALALAGASFSAAIEVANTPARPLNVPQSLSLAPGERLVIGGAAVGARIYVAVKGGWRTPLWLGGRSREDRLKPGDIVEALPGRTPVRRPAVPFWEIPDRGPLRIIEGPDTSLAVDMDRWAEGPFRVGPQMSRMGLRLEGPELSVQSSPERLSTPVAPGAVQIAGGQAILLGIACGTMGGYPHVANVISADLDRLGQFRPGDPIRFQRITLAEARRIGRIDRALWCDRLRLLTAMSGDMGD